MSRITEARAMICEEKSRLDAVLVFENLRYTYGRVLGGAPWKY